MIRQLHNCIILNIYLGILSHIAQANNDVLKVYNTTDLEWLWLEWQQIAVPTGQRGEIVLAPNKPPNKTKIDLEMFAVEIIEFDVKSQQFTIRMGLRINWSENRLKLLSSSLVDGWMTVPSNTIWSPKIDIQSVEVSEKRTQELIEVRTESYSEVSQWDFRSKKWDNYIHYFMQSSSAKMKFSLTTTVKCSMNFRMFPFDSHICKLEVS